MILLNDILREFVHNFVIIRSNYFETGEVAGIIKYGTKMYYSNGEPFIFESSSDKKKVLEVSYWFVSSDRKLNAKLLTSKRNENGIITGIGIHKFSPFRYSLWKEFEM